MREVGQKLDEFRTSIVVKATQKHILLSELSIYRENGKRDLLSIWFFNAIM
jgi:hypothetical protein